MYDGCVYDELYMMDVCMMDVCMMDVCMMDVCMDGCVYDAVSCGGTRCGLSAVWSAGSAEAAVCCPQLRRAGAGAASRVGSTTDSLQTGTTTG